MARPLADCGVVVLGGSAGVGLESAAQFAGQGSRIVLLGRNPERGAQACGAVRDRVPEADVSFIRVDAVDAGDAARAEAECRERLGAIDVLMCTTGPSEPPQLLHDIPLESIERRLDELILPPLHMMKVTLPAMRAQRCGVVVTVCSDAAKVATPGETLVGAAMGAIMMFCKAAALEVKREGVRINLLTPSLIEGTPGAALIEADPFSAKMFAKAAAQAHLGVPDSSDQAAMAVFLASPAARRITGQAISINGGISVA